MSDASSLGSFPDLGDRVYHLIREQILSGKMPPGSLLLGVELAREIGVSRTPVADALNVLAADGLVQIVPRKGYFVASIDSQDYRHLADARLALELAAAERVTFAESRLAALRQALEAARECADANGNYQDYQEWIKRDMRFHEVVVDSGANPYLGELYRRLSARVHLAHTHFYQAAHVRSVQESLVEHEAIFAAFAAGDLVALKSAVTEHVARSSEFYASAAPEPQAQKPVAQQSAVAPPGRRLSWLGRNHPAKAQG